jgi:CubicO group peptidase (beta-lactamase class C family)
MMETTRWAPSRQTLDEVDAMFRSWVDEGGVPGVSYGVVSREGLVHAAGHGVVRERGPRPEATTAFRIASISKSFTAASIMLLVQRGALSLMDPVSRFVPEFRAVRRPTSDSPEVTVGMLLSMSGGLPTDDAWADRQESMSRGAFGRLLNDGIRFVAAPGTTYEYSNLGYAVLGCVVEAASELPYHDFVEQHLISPLGMTSTGFDTSVAAPGGIATGHVRLDERWHAVPFSSPGVFSAIGGLFSTVEDLCLWVRWFADAFPARDSEDAGPLCRALRREMQQAHRAIPPTHRTGGGGNDPAVIASGYGYGLVIDHDLRWGDVVSHSGGYPGFGSHMRWHPGTGLGVIALANGRYAPCEAKASAALQALLSDAKAPSGRVTLWPETIRARAAVERLLREWDTTLADTWFADNVEMDLDVSHRRSQIRNLVDTVEPLPDPTSPDELIRSDSPAHVVWGIPGVRGMLRCEIRLNPENPPRIQTLVVTVDDSSPSNAIASGNPTGGEHLAAAPAK